MLEAVKLDDIDAKLVQEAYAKAKSSFDGAEAGSVSKAEAQISVDTTKALASAIGISL